MPTSENKALAEDIKNIQGCIMRLEGQARRNAEYSKKTRDHTVDIDHMVQLHADDIREIMGLFQTLAQRISRIEECLGITEPVQVPLD